MAAQARTYDISQARQRRTQTIERQAGRIGMGNERLARALGWFSIGVGLAEVVAPRRVARLIGSDDHSTVLRVFGLREIASGVGILAAPRPAPWLWSRVGGDMIDLAFLGRVLTSRRADRSKAAAASAAVAGVTVLDALCAQQLSTAPGPGPIRVETSIVVNRSPEECYRFWRDVQNLPRFMSYLESVRVTDEKRSHWVVRGPGDVRVEWDAEIVDDVPNQRIAWRSLPGAEFPNSGSVHFEPAPGGRGAIVRVQMEYGSAGQVLGSALAKLIGKDPEQLIKKDLRRFKQVLETGEVLTTEGQPAGRLASTTVLDRIAR